MEHSNEQDAQADKPRHNASCQGSNAHNFQKTSDTLCHIGNRASSGKQHAVSSSSDDDGDKDVPVIKELETGCDKIRLHECETSTTHCKVQEMPLDATIQAPKRTSAVNEHAQESILSSVTAREDFGSRLNQNIANNQKSNQINQNNQADQSTISNIQDTSKTEESSTSTEFHTNSRTNKNESGKISTPNITKESSQKSPTILQSVHNDTTDDDPHMFHETHVRVIETNKANVESAIADTTPSASDLTSTNSKFVQRPGISSKLQSHESRPIYPNIPYSPYASPYSSPHSNRRRPPLRESRRVSIEQSGSFLQLNQYKLMDQIGQGSYGLVKLAYSEEDSIHYAMKILSKRKLLRQVGLLRRGPKKTTSPLDRVYREIAVLKKLDHPNVVKLIEVLDDPMEDSLYMVFELVKQGEVLSIPTNKPLSEERTWSVLRDTLLGLEYLHYQRIIHGDLKPGNLLLTECGHVKIADLGVCNEFLGEDATMSSCSTAGTPAFRAPETLVIGQHKYCGKATDIWALGATLYALIFGNVPFLANTIPMLYEKIKHDDVTFLGAIKISEELKNCILCMLTKDPCKRITLPQLKEHVWVTTGGLYPLANENENCRLIQVSDDDINSVVRSIPKLDTLILIKTMLKKHSFGNPFNRSVSGRAPQRGGSRLERFIRAGRSNSAPGAYNMAIDRQLSGDSLLPSLSELSSSLINEET